MKKYFTYFLCILMIGWTISGCIQKRKFIPSLNESYRRTDKLPFGSFIAYKRFQSEFPHYWINIANKSFDKTWKDLEEDRGKKYSLYFLITKNLILSIDEVNAMMEYVKAGNDLFISADYIDPKLLEAVYCSTDRKGEIISEVNGKMKDTHVSMFYGNNFKAPEYSYYYYPFLNYFNSYDTGYSRVLGVNELNLPNYLVLFAGRGRLYLHTAPRIFSNYFLLTKGNYHYFDYVTAYLRFEPQYVYWDEYYKDISSTKNKNNLNKDHFSTMEVIQKNPPLKWAFYLALAGILLFVFSNLKRKQRQIPLLAANTNSTVAFTETVGRLYLQNKDNRNIAEKIITYFYDYLRNKYFINTSVINKEFLNSLSGKSGVAKNETNELFEFIEAIGLQETVSDEELLRLNSMIENFKNNKKDGRKTV